MIWGKIILLLLQMAHSLLELAEKNKWISEGEQRAIAASSLEVARKVSIGKKILEEVSGLSDQQVDDALRALEPDSVPTKLEPKV